MSDDRNEMENTILASEEAPVKNRLDIIALTEMFTCQSINTFARLLTEIFRTLVEEKLHYRVEILEAEGEQQLARYNSSETADTDNATLCLNPGCVVML